MERKTVRPSPVSAEQLVFTPIEAELGIVSLAYMIETDRRQERAEWGTHAAHALSRGIQEALHDIDTHADTMRKGQSIMQRLANVAEHPQIPVGLSASEVRALGFAVYQFGNYGMQLAKESVAEQVRERDTSKMQTMSQLDKKGMALRSLFQSLTPIVIAKEDYRRLGWPEWGGVCAIVTL